MRRVCFLLAIPLATAIPAASAGEDSQRFQGIRSGDIAFVKADLTKSEIKVRGQRGSGPFCPVVQA
jgi:hypothetical protein